MCVYIYIYIYIHVCLEVVGGVGRDGEEVVEAAAAVRPDELLLEVLKVANLSLSIYIHIEREREGERER